MVICLLMFSCSRSQAANTTPYYYVETPTVDVNLSYEIESEERSGPFINTDKDTSTSKQEFDIRTRGWVYHPALMVFSAGLRPEFKQQDVDVNTGTAQEDDATFLGYFFDTTLLQHKPYTVTLFASEDRRDFASSLASDSTTESSTYRGQLLLKYQPVPTTITVESKDEVTESFFLTSEKSEKVRIDSRHQTLSSETKLEAEVLERSRSIRGTELSGEQNFMFVSNAYKLGGDSNLFSSLRYSDNTSGAVDSTTASFSSQLWVRHRENLKTNYQLRIEDRDEGVFTSKKQLGIAELTHQLYENLTTTLRGEVDKNEFAEGDFDAYAADIGFRYMRKIPWGNLNINLGHRKRIEDDQRQLAFAEVRDESHVLTGTAFELLDNDVIDINSIVVTDITGTIIYVDGIDYVLTIVGNNVQIERSLFGGISDGQVVLVDYSFEADPPAKIANITNSFDINLNLWSMLRLYYQKNQSTEEFISGIEPSELTDDTVQRTGFELSWKWSTTKVEVEDRDTTRTPTKRYRFSETLLFRPGRNMSFGFVADYSELELVDTGDELETTGLSMNFQWDLRRSGQLSIEGSSQQIKGSAQRSDQDGLKALYQWRYGAWRPRISYVFVDEVDHLTSDSRKRSNLYFEIGRKF